MDVGARMVIGLLDGAEKCTWQGSEVVVEGSGAGFGSPNDQEIHHGLTHFVPLDSGLQGPAKTSKSHGACGRESKH